MELADEDTWDRPQDLAKEQRGVSPFLQGRDRSDTEFEKEQPTNRIKRRWQLLKLALVISIWYAFSISLTLYNKWLFAIFDFHFPLATTTIHFGLKMPLADIGMRCFGVQRLKWPQCSLLCGRGTLNAASRSSRRLWLYVAAVGATTALDVALSNASFLYLSVAYYTIVKASVPLWILLFSVILGLVRLRIQTVLVLLLITAGIALASVSPEPLTEAQQGTRRLLSRLLATADENRPLGLLLVLTASCCAGFGECSPDRLLSCLRKKSFSCSWPPAGARSNLDKTIERGRGHK